MTGHATLLMDMAPSYRWQAFVAGLQRLGYRVGDKPRRDLVGNDILVIWNRHRHQAEALVYDRAGLPVVVAENGYIGKDNQGRQLYALARDQHNGAGRWFVGDEDRWSVFGIPTSEWRRKGEHILVLPQRGIGPRGVAMPRSWLDDILRRLKVATKRPVQVRAHPGMERPPMKPDLAGCWAAVTWGSGAAIKALAGGAPVFYEFDRWIGGPAARFGIDHLEDPFLGDRDAMFKRLAHAQWTVDEIATGEPFKRLLSL